MEFNLISALVKGAVLFPPFLFALCFHEFAHGWEARRRGDNTAFLMGRITLNPIPHMDPIGTLVLPLFGLISGIPFIFGWAKPVPVNPRNLNNVAKDMFWIAAAGPLSNILLAFISILGLLILSHTMGETSQIIMTILLAFGMFNIVLAVFNLIPLHPLDGGKILARFLPDKWNQALESNQMMNLFILLALMFTGIIGNLIQFVAIPYLHLLLILGVDINSLLNNLQNLGS